MKIKELELNNFRVYYGKNTIDLTTSDERNIVVISGENGFGKTTFLMSIIWCLYGKQMEYVDEMYKSEIVGKKGGYTGYMNSCLNKTAAANGNTKFSVSLTLVGLDMPHELKCNEIKITRSYDITTSAGDDLTILFDGKLIEEVFPTVPKEERIEAEEFFIRERIMPIEIAKFFFFDAERIVAYSELDTAEQQKNLAIAYSQVLGIQKYNSLRDTLTAIKDDYRKMGVSSSERDEYNKLLVNISTSDDKIKEINQRITELNVEIKNKEDESSSLQERLLLEGNTMTQEQLEDYRSKQQNYKAEMDSAQSGLKDLYNYIPFGLSGELFAQLVDQVKKETEHRQRKIQIAIADEQTNELLNELDDESHSVDFPIDRKIRRFYEDVVKKLIRKHFYNEGSDLEDSDFVELHGLTEVQSNTLLSFVSKIKGAQKDFTGLYDTYKRAKREFYFIEQKIREAEARSESTFIAELKQSKKEVDEDVLRLKGLQQTLLNDQKTLSDEIVADRKRKEVLSNKIQISDQYSKKDKAITRLIQSIDTFIMRFEEERKKSLQTRIYANLCQLLHKKGLITDVKVFIYKNLVDISLMGADGNKQEISDLSNGEKQMFSTALLSALVEETGLQFPVFIDSPLQKFDRSHSQNILEKFYPNISKQVVLFPLIYKELNEKEYMIIKDRTEKVYVIQNEENVSHFEPTHKDNLFNE